jgi:hypothetical protein
MTVMPSFAAHLHKMRGCGQLSHPLQTKDSSSYPDAAFMDDPKLKEEGKKWVRLFGCLRLP